MLVKYLRWILIINFCVFFDACKPRRRSSGIKSNSSAELSVEQAKEITVIEAQLQMSDYITAPRIAAMIADLIADSGQEPAKEISMPENCLAAEWNKDHNWTWQFIELWLKKLNRGDVHIRVQMHAIAAISDLGQKLNLSCLQPAIAELLRTNLFENSDHTLCNSFSGCNDIIAQLDRIMPLFVNTNYSEAFRKYLEPERYPVGRFEISNKALLPGEEVFVALIQYRAESLLAKFDFMNVTSINSAPSRGIYVLLNDTEYCSLKQSFYRLIEPKSVNFRVQTVTLFKALGKEGLRNIDNVKLYRRIIAELFPEYLPDPQADTQDVSLDYQPFDGLDFQERKIVFSLADEFIEHVKATYNQNYAMYLYLDRLRQVDPNPWIKSIMNQVMAFKEIEERKLQNNSIPPSPLERDEIYALLDLKPSVTGCALPSGENIDAGPSTIIQTNAELKPNIAVAALTVAAQYEAVLPFRGDFYQAAKNSLITLQQLPSSATENEVLRATTSFTNLASMIGIFDQFRKNFVAQQMANGATLLAPNDPRTPLVDRMNKALSILYEKEKKILFAEKLQNGAASFVSVNNELMRYIQYSGTFNTESKKHLDTVVNQKKMDKAWDTMWDPGSTLWQTVRDPGSGTEFTQEVVDNATAAVKSQYLSLLCLSFKYDENNREQTLRINEKFFFNDDPIQFSCNKNWGMNEIRTNTLQYSLDFAYQSGMRRLKNAINSHPAKQALDLVFSSIAVGRIAKLAVKAAEYLKAVSAASRVFGDSVRYGQSLYSMSRVFKVSTDLGKSFTDLAFQSYVFSLVHYSGGKISENLAKETISWLDSDVNFQNSLLEKEPNPVNPFFDAHGFVSGMIVMRALPVVHRTMSTLLRATYKPNVRETLLNSSWKVRQFLNREMDAESRRYFSSLAQSEERYLVERSRVTMDGLSKAQSDVIEKAVVPKKFSHVLKQFADASSVTMAEATGEFATFLFMGDLEHTIMQSADAIFKLPLETYGKTQTYQEYKEDLAKNVKHDESWALRLTRTMVTVGAFTGHRQGPALLKTPFDIIKARELSKETLDRVNAFESFLFRERGVARVVEQERVAQNPWEVLNIDRNANLIRDIDFNKLVLDQTNIHLKQIEVIRKNSEYLKEVSLLEYEGLQVKLKVRESEVLASKALLLGESNWVDLLNKVPSFPVAAIKRNIDANAPQGKILDILKDVYYKGRKGGAFEYDPEIDHDGVYAGDGVFFKDPRVTYQRSKDFGAYMEAPGQKPVDESLLKGAESYFGKSRDSLDTQSLDKEYRKKVRDLHFNQGKTQEMYPKEWIELNNFRDEMQKYINLRDTPN